MSWNFPLIWNNLSPLFNALLTSISLSLSSIFIGTVIGIAVGIISLMKMSLIAYVARSFTELFLSLPVLIILVWLYYGLPLILPSVSLDAMTCAILGLGLSLSAFVAEIIRGGINSVPLGEIEAAYCTGLSQFQAVRYILIPQVLRKSWLPIMGQYITTYKLSTLASVIAVPEILHVSNQIIAQTYRPLEIYSTVATMFVVTIIPLNMFLRRIQNVKRLGGIEKI